MTIDYTGLDRAIRDGITAERQGRTTWIVTGSRGNLYTVAYGGEGGIAMCNCPAGRNGRRCKHLALVEVLEASGAVAIPAHPEISEERKQAAADWDERYARLIG